MSDSPTEPEADRTTETDRRRNDLDTDVMKWVSGIVALAGLGLVAYPFMFEATEMAFWSDIITGVAIFVFAGYNFFRLSRDRLASVGMSSVTALLGLWALASPAVMEMGSGALAATTAAGGLITAALSAYNAYANSRADTPEEVPARA